MATTSTLFRLAICLGLCVSVLVLTCISFPIALAQGPNAVEWAQFHTEHMTLIQNQVKVLERLYSVEKRLYDHESQQVNYPATLAIIEFKLDGIRMIAQWFIALLSAIIIGGAGCFWKFLIHSRAVNSKLDALDKSKGVE